MTKAPTASYSVAHTMKSETVDEALTSAKDRLPSDVAARIRDVPQIVEEFQRHLIGPASSRDTDFLYDGDGLPDRSEGSDFSQTDVTPALSR
jgi:predicted Zn-dependent protease with MMP-like domain